MPDEPGNDIFEVGRIHLSKAQLDDIKAELIEQAAEPNNAREQRRHAALTETRLTSKLGAPTIPITILTANRKGKLSQNH